MLASPLTAQASNEVELVVRLVVHESHADASPREVTVEFTEASTGEPAASRVVPGLADGEPQDVRVILPLHASRSGWFASARAPGWWSPATYVAPDGREASLTLVPQGTVRLAVDGADTGVDLLDAGNVWIAGRLAGRGVRLERGVHRGPCQVDSESDPREVRIACPFARDEAADLRVRLGPFLPLLRSEVTIAADMDLGRIRPVRGATVTGSLASADGASHRLRLMRTNAPLALGWSAWTDSGGAFAFEGLSPGVYELRLAAADGDSWPVSIDSPADRVDLGQLVSAAGNLFVISFLVPATVELDRLRPRLSTVTLGPDGDVKGRRRLSKVGERDEDGAWRWRGLSAGDYEVQVEDEGGNRWGRELLRFFGNDRHYVELDAVPLAGRIRRGGEPLQDIMVWFGGLWGVERVSFRSGDEGRFSGLLPRSGFWPVSVTPAPDCDPCEGGWDNDGWDGFDDRIVDDAGVVEIEADLDGVARIEIELSPGAISGRVVRREADTGRLEPVDQAHVRVRAVDEVAGERLDALQPSEWQRRTGASGAFYVTGLPAWEYEIISDGRFQGQELRSRPRLVRVTGDDRVGDLELLLEGRRPLLVAVRSAGAPVPGAQTLVLHPAGSARVESGRHTRGAGSATHFVPMDAEFVDVVARAEGLGMNGWRFRVDEGVPLALDLESNVGSLRLPDDWSGRLMTPGGAWIKVGTLAAIDDRWGQVRRDGDQFVVEGLAVGAWTYCPEGAGCSTVDVAPWAETRVP